MYNAAVDLVDRHLEAGRGAKLAYIDPRRQLPYAELKERTDRLANAIRSLGVQREQRIVLIMLDTIDFPVAFWATIKAGAVAVPLNTLLPAELWRYQIEDSRATVVIVSAELMDRAGPMLAQVQAAWPLIVLTTEDLARIEAAAAPDCTPAPTHPDEVAFWLYPSGSTGQPKAARHLHASPAATAQCFGQGILGITADDVMFSAAKLFFAYGLGNGMSFPLSVGATTILLPDRPTPDTVLATVAAHHPTIFCGVPTLYAAILADPRLSRGLGSRRLRACISAGEALPAEIGTRWRERVGLDIVDGIGSTEMLHIFVSNRLGDIRYGSSGKPVPGYRAQIVNEQGDPTPAGEIGELMVSGPTAAEGYWNQRERSRKTFVGEWTMTGDKYRIDEDGYYHFCGRTDDMFKTGGIWVAPFEVESALISHPAVLEAAVVGHPDSDELIKPRAFLVLNPGFHLDDRLVDELRSHVKAVAGPWKYPRWIEAVAELPKTATGKIQRFKLRT